VLSLGLLSLKSSIIRFIIGIMVYPLFIRLMKMGKRGIPYRFLGDQKCDLNQKLKLVKNKLGEALSST